MRLPEGIIEPPGTPAERDLLVRPGKDKPGLIKAIAETLASGYVLRSRVIAGVLPRFGYSRRSADTTATNMMRNGYFIRGLKEHGVVPAVRKYRGKNLYYDASLPVEDTDLEEVKAEIEAELEDF